MLLVPFERHFADEGLLESRNPIDVDRKFNFQVRD